MRLLNVGWWLVSGLVCLPPFSRSWCNCFGIILFRPVFGLSSEPIINSEIGHNGAESYVNHADGVA